MTVSRRAWLFPVLCLVAVATLVGAYSNSFNQLNALSNGLSPPRAQSAAGGASALIDS